MATVVAGRGSPGADPCSGHVLVEREQEIDVLRGVVDDLVSGTPRTVLLRGPGGVGRSALLRWTRVQAETAGCRVLAGRCSRGEAARRFGLVAQLDPLRQGESEEVATRMRATLLAEAARHPLLLLLDDVQWIDRASARWLSSMITRPAHRPVTVVFAATDPFARDWQEYGIRSLPAPMTVRRLRPLSSRAVLEVLRARAGEIDPGVARVVADSTGGRPALVHDAAEFLAAEPRLCGEAATVSRGEGETVPRGEGETVSCGEGETVPRGTGLPELARRCAEASADRAAAFVTGLPSELADLVRVLALEPGNLDFELVCALAGVRTMALAEARELVSGLELGAGFAPGAERILAGVDVPRGAGFAPAAERILAGVDAPRGAGFAPGAERILAGVDAPRGTSFAPTAERILAGLDAQRRADLYARAATIAHRGALPDQDVARLLLRARPIGERWVVETLCREAARARNVREFGVAVELLARALHEPLDDVRRGMLEIDLAIASTPDSPLAGERLLRRVLLRADDPELAEVRLAAADLLVAKGDDVQARSAIGAACGRTGVAAAERAALSALYWIADEASHDVTEFDLPVAVNQPGRPDGPDQAGVEAWRLAVRGDDLAAARALAMAALEGETRLVTSQVLVCRTLMLTDDVTEALAGLGRAIALAQERGSGVLGAVAHLARGKVHARDGRFEEAAADLETALAHHPRPDWHPLALPGLVAFEATLALEQGRISAAESLLDVEWEPRVRRGFGWAQVLLTQGLLDLHRGRPADAVIHLRECGRRLLARGWTNPALLGWRALTAFALRALGRQEEAAALIIEELGLAGRWGTRTAVGSGHLVASLVLTGAEAEQHCAEAVRLLRGSGWRFRYAQAVAELAGHRVSSGAIGEALDLLIESDQLTGEFGSAHLTEHLRGTAARIGELLSPTERRITELAGCGLSNVDIATQLSVSRRTVEWHLSGIYRKTGGARRHRLRDLLDLAVVEGGGHDDAGA